MRKYFQRHYTKGLVIVRQFQELPPLIKKRIYVILIIALLIAFLGITFRVIKAIQLRHTTERQTILNVAVMKAKSGPKTEEVILPGDVQAWHEATLYARINGYVKEWYTDIGSHVKTGQLLALIDAPDLDEQLLQAQADLKAAQANNELAQITNTRWQILLKTESVSKQDALEKTSSAQANQSLVAAAQANRDRLETLVEFEKITAPFDGVITLRNIDIGDLITAGSNALQPLFKIVQADKLRVYVKVPQNYVSQITPNMTVTLSLSDYPDKTFSATLLNTAQGIDLNTRTLLTEFVADNPDNILLSGSYAQVHFSLPLPDTAIRLPVNTLLFRSQGLQVATLDANHHVVLRTITIGRDFGKEVEVIAGIAPEDTIILNPSDALINGQPVNVIKDANKEAIS